MFYFISEIKWLPVMMNAWDDFYVLFDVIYERTFKVTNHKINLISICENDGQCKLINSKFCIYVYIIKPSMCQIARILIYKK